MPQRVGQKTCSYPCALDHNRNKVADKKRKAFDAETRRRREALKTRSQWVKEVQLEFNRFIRYRDHGQPCISCQRSTGAKVNAGHYRPTGSCPELRFNELNCHLQCEHCNMHRSGAPTEYRINLIEKIGLPLVEWLEGPHKPMKITIDELKYLKRYYRDRAKEAKSYLEAA